MTRFRAAGELVDDLSAEFTTLTGLLDQRHPASVQRRLTRVTAQMAGLMFLSLIKLDERSAARSWARTACIAAEEAGDPTLLSWVRAQEAYVHFYCGDMAEARRVAIQAYDAAGRNPCVGVALAAALHARTCGILGDADGVHRAIELAQTTLGRLGPDDQAASAFGYNDAQLGFHAGNAYTHLGQTDTAWAHQTAALARYPVGDFLDRGLVHLDRVACLAREGEVAAATEYAVTSEITGMSAPQRAGLFNARTAEVLAAVPAPVRALPSGNTLREILSP